MLIAFRALRAAGAEFFFDLPRMVFLNLLWFLTSLPTIYLAAVGAGLITSQLESGWDVRPFLFLTPVSLLALGVTGPGTAAVYTVTNRFANGELLEVSGFWSAFRRYYWRGWALACLDAAALAILMINVIFYWSMEGVGAKLLSLVFAYFLLIWVAIQGYLFSLLVELDQPVARAVRNSLFLTIDNLGVTLGLGIVNLLLIAITATSIPVAVPFVMASLGSSIHNKVIVEAVARYRAQGRLFSDKGSDKGAA